MKTMPAAEAKTNFGALIDSAQREPITISKKGRPVAVLMSMQEYREHEAMKLERLRREIKVGLDQIEHGETFDGEETFSQLEKELDS